MITAPVRIELRPLAIPASIDSPDAADFIEMVRVRNRIYAQISGHDDHRIAADELLPIYQPDEHALALNRGNLLELQDVVLRSYEPDYLGLHYPIKCDRANLDLMIAHRLFRACGKNLRIYSHCASGRRQAPFGFT